MVDDAVLREILELKKDLGSYNDRLIELRYQDFKSAFTDQMRQIVSEEGLRSFDLGLQTMDSKSDCASRTDCMKLLSSVIESSIQALNQDDLGKAMAILEDAERTVVCKIEKCPDKACSTAAGESIRKAKAVLMVYRRLTGEMSSRKTVIALAASPSGEVTPEQVEDALSPLANARRIEILRLLSAGDRSLSDISKELKLKTGHLLFHIKALKEAGLVSQDRRTKQYRLTGKGAAALRSSYEMATEIARH
jgi:DNA-binding transcriptional ArsR family regulator